MARPRNDGQRDAVARAAFAVFVRKGYTAASYTDIAQEAGMERGLVQHYFPRKQLLITSFMDRALSSAEELILEEAADDDELVTLYRTGRLYFSFLLANGRMRTLTLDVASHREITSAVVFLSQEWAFAYLHPDQGRVNDD